jgi:hypothetical protein
VSSTTPPSGLRTTNTSRGGAIGIAQETADGSLLFVELPRIRTYRNADRSGRYRWYNDYRLPDEYGSNVITVRLHGTDDDSKRKFNRTENVRAISPSDPDFTALYKRRNDAESINRALDDTLWLRRAHSVGHHRQHLNLLTYALGVNALAVHRHSRRQGPTATGRGRLNHHPADRVGFSACTSTRQTLNRAPSASSQASGGPFRLPPNLPAADRLRFGEGFSSTSRAGPALVGPVEYLWRMGSEGG